jgi:hypothetical protein
MARKVQGYTTNSSLANLRKPQELDLNDLGALPLITSYQIGAAPAATLAAGVTVQERGDGVFHQTVFTLTDVALTTTDAAAAGAHTSLQLYDFPACLLSYIGGSMSLTLTAGDGGLADNAAMVAGVGTATAGTDNGTLTTTEQDLIPSTAYTLSSGTVTAGAKSVTATAAVFDGTSTAKDAWLNIVVPDAGTSADDTLTVSGTVVLTWVHLGDV